MPLTSGSTSTQTQAEARTKESVSQNQLGSKGQRQGKIDMQQVNVAGQALSGAEAGAETERLLDGAAYVAAMAEGGEHRSAFRSASERRGPKLGRRSTADTDSWKAHAPTKYISEPQ